MDVKIEMTDDVAVLIPAGNLVASETDSFNLQIAKLIENNILFMLLDMSRINFIDSSGLDAVMAVRKLVTNGGGIIACAALNDNVLKVFRVTWADQKISITTTRSDGLRMIQELRTAQA
ncbi:MAG: hypothetical protein A2X80_08110 [Geobacteraceae bacterium GWB2_52_12]|nr:MAG: hypothetical protein A2X80_08110 [Geobacteraceae bacterium GWB2_52_12]